MDEPQLRHRKLRTALWAGAIAVGFAVAFILEVWLR
jgi:hypothetical protein